MDILLTIAAMIVILLTVYLRDVMAEILLPWFLAIIEAERRFFDWFRARVD